MRGANDLHIVQLMPLPFHHLSATPTGKSWILSIPATLLTEQFL